MDDVRAVMDAAGSERAALFGHSEGASMAILFAATYPERTTALVTFGAFACRLRNPDYPWAPTREDREHLYEIVERDWGGDVDMSDLAPSMAHDEGFRRRLSTYLRLSASPGAALALARTRHGSRLGGPDLATHISLLICCQRSNIAGEPS